MTRCIGSLPRRYRFTRGTVLRILRVLRTVGVTRARGGPLDSGCAHRGGHTRIRPILMTAIATILALVPLAAGFNEGSIIAAELGTVVIGGLLSATLLTLLVIPVLYSLVDSVKRRLRAVSPRARTP